MRTTDVECGVAMEAGEDAWNARGRSVAGSCNEKMTEWKILGGTYAIRHGSFLLRETENVRMPFSSHSQNR